MSSRRLHYSKNPAETHRAGGVVVGSPIVGAGEAEKLWGLPLHYINAHITYQGEEKGAFQRLERGELALDDFYRQFGEQLSNVETGNLSYRAYCKKAGIPCPELPTKLSIDGKEVSAEVSLRSLWWLTALLSAVDNDDEAFSHSGPRHRLSHQRSPK